MITIEPIYQVWLIEAPFCAWVDVEYDRFVAEPLITNKRVLCNYSTAMAALADCKLGENAS